MKIDKTLSQIGRALLAKRIDFYVEFANGELQLTSGEQFELTGFGEAYENAAGETELFIYDEEPDTAKVMAFFYPPKKPKPPKYTYLDK